MTSENKAVLTEANARVARGDYEGFLAFCTDDTRWTFVGDRVLNGKDAVRQYMAEAYEVPPVFNTSDLLGEGETVTALGEITLREQGQAKRYAYCDVWKLRDGKLAELRAFVVPLSDEA